MAYWGKQWLMIANPTYGSFDTATYGHDFKKPLAEQRKAKWDVLEILGRSQAVAARSGRSDRRFALGVEQVQALGLQRQLEVVVGAHAQRRLDARHHQGRPDAGIEQDLRAELLDHLDGGIEAILRRVRGARDMDVLRPDAERGLAAGLDAGPCGQCIGQPDPAALAPRRRACRRFPPGSRRRNSWPASR